jgi:hypothetical protein
VRKLDAEWLFPKQNATLHELSMATGESKMLWSSRRAGNAATLGFDESLRDPWLPFGNDKRLG